MNKAYIFTVHHKKDIAIDIFLKYFNPIQVGAAISDESLGIDRDDFGDNISSKNKNYCELTAHYNIWKRNLPVDFIGLMHYRRVFSTKSSLKSIFTNELKFIFNRIFLLRLKFALNKQIKISDKSKLDAVCKEFNFFLLNEDLDLDLILPKKIKFQFFSVKEDYFLNHCRSHFDIFNNIIFREYPEMKKAVEKVCSSKEMYAYNMFVMRKEIFDDYSSRLFNVLEKAELVIDVKYLDLYQKRIFGFLSERFLNYYVQYLIECKKIKIKELDIAFLEFENK